MDSPSLSPSSHVNPILGKLLANEKEGARRWLQLEMISLVDPLLDSLFRNLETKLSSALETEVQTGNNSNQARMNSLLNSILNTNTHDLLSNGHQTVSAHIQNQHQPLTSSPFISSSSLYNPTSYSFNSTFNHQTGQHFAQSTNSIQFNLTQPIKDEEENEEGSPIYKPTNLITNDEQSTNYNLTNQNDEEDDEDDCDCPDCLNIGIKDKVLADDNEEEDDDDVQWIDDDDEIADINLPVKKVRMNNSNLIQSQSQEPIDAIEQFVAQAMHSKQTNIQSTSNGQSTSQLTSNQQLTSNEQLTSQQPNISYVFSTPEKQIITLALQCPQCLEMHIEDDLKNHMWTRHSIHSAQCVVKDCGQSFHNKHNLGQHVKEAHPQHSTTQWHCDKCLKHFTKYIYLFIHNFKLHHRGLFQCSYPGCSFTGEYRSKVSGHYQSRHKQLLECSYAGCEFRTMVLGNFRQHLQTHHQ